MRELLLYDTLTRATRELEPSDGRSLRIYCCGPTVYGPAHIGNFRTFVLQDVLRRTIESMGMPTLHVRNLTDVDDKTIRESRAAGVSLANFTAKWVRQFHSDCEALNILPPHVEQSAVEAIPLQIELVAKLVESGHAYRADDGSVYFDVSSHSGYGALSRLKEREITTESAPAGAQGRESDDEYDRDSAADFALWKARRPEDGDNFWESPWGEGRPGWHTECAAMSLHHLGESFDLHCGGVDLVFPHHENEIAQAECATGASFARHWFHSAHLMVDGSKMSKSLGNMHTLDDVRARGFFPMELRYVLLSGNYRQPLNFTWDSLNAARQALKRLRKLRSRLVEQAGGIVPEPDPSVGQMKAAWACLLDDLNTPEALGRMFSAAKEIDHLQTAGELDDLTAMAELQGLDGMLEVLGIDLEVETGEASGGREIPESVRQLAEERWKAREARDWKRADTLRDELAKMGWRVKDSREGYELTPLEMP